MRGEEDWHLSASLSQDTKPKLKLVKGLQSWKDGMFQNCRHLAMIGTGLWRPSVPCAELGIWNRGEKDYWFGPSVFGYRGALRTGVHLPTLKADVATPDLHETVI